MFREILNEKLNEKLNDEDYKSILQGIDKSISKVDANLSIEDLGTIIGIYVNRCYGVSNSSKFISAFDKSVKETNSDFSC